MPGSVRSNPGGTTTAILERLLLQGIRHLRPPDLPPLEQLAASQRVDDSAPRIAERSGPVGLEPGDQLARAPQDDFSVRALDGDADRGLVRLHRHVASSS